MQNKTALFWGENGYGYSAVCRLCPHGCKIEEGEYGICNARMNCRGTLVSASYGRISALNLDPVEKKPLFHFYPGSKTLSFGSFGCNLKCGFCQNHSISMNRPDNKVFLKPDDAAYFATEKNIKLISYTYNEPLINYEWVKEMSEICRKKGMQNILITNGFINKQPLREISGYIDAANIDIKAFNDGFYKKNCGGILAPVIKTIEELYLSKVHIELTNLVIEGENDSEAEFSKMVDFIKGIDDEIPFHISRYFPGYKFTLPETSQETLLKLYGIAKEKLHNVYLGNIDILGYESTYCKNCGFCLIERNGYNIKINCKNPRICCECGARNNIII